MLVAGLNAARCVYLHYSCWCSLDIFTTLRLIANMEFDCIDCILSKLYRPTIAEDMHARVIVYDAFAVSRLLLEALNVIKSVQA
ncbi:hypothetical protein HBH56_108540 [Parastagonospora nodorum]|uniref:Uncharacterized protein n=1 Tax=Phaeosphaeria nodorum (strain SN15 / ATCC MYA-4574 / FGSC 10173) TaxID=321614 RepID=A0A7U2FDD9_PHANO|nr:hypothetical protein HBH56_108540 [Parastagonospora nodorum]QRD03203.1 hypothetical protein JI435_419250 [Parastagonospora nodorum SN15]KAH3922347.1 hypothetical protein HBH54_225640 [Parastagonospora nodorum]KAH4034999.1 hypothetical protein HBI09_093940 [Parastagonospora nodorum]KAH4048994.1 hypothetical protein HBH49_154010 [Parastagonospora nodorum]